MKHREIELIEKIIDRLERAEEDLDKALDTIKPENKAADLVCRALQGVLFTLDELRDVMAGIDILIGQKEMWYKEAGKANIRCSEMMVKLNERST